MKKKIFLLTLTLSTLLLGVGCIKQNEYTQNADSDYKTPIQVGSKKLFVQIANTNALRQQGLSGKTELQQDHGMLFDFTNTNDTRPSFWMKEMQFAIDIIWINDNKIIGITKSVPAPSAGTTDYELKTYPPPGDISFVLEVNAGWSDKNNITVGDELKF